MPFESKRQQRFMFANPSVLGGIDKVMEWAHATNFKTLPETARKLHHRMPPPPNRKKK